MAVRLISGASGLFSTQHFLASFPSGAKRTKRPLPLSAVANLTFRKGHGPPSPLMPSPSSGGCSAWTLRDEQLSEASSHTRGCSRTLPEGSRTAGLGLFPLNQRKPALSISTSRRIWPNRREIRGTHEAFRKRSLPPRVDSRLRGARTLSPRPDKLERRQNRAFRSSSRHLQARRRRAGSDRR